MDHATAIRKLSDIATKVTKPNSTGPFQRAKGLIDTIFNPVTPSFAVGINKVREATSAIDAYVQTDSRHMVTEIKEALCLVLHGRGYRDINDISTLQEHRIRGSSYVMEGDAGYSLIGGEPHKPVAILEGRLSPAEVRIARQLQGCLNVFDTLYNLDLANAEHAALIVGEVWVSVAFEELDTANRTLRDPRIVRVLSDGIEVVQPEILQAPDFPFSRLNR